MITVFTPTFNRAYRLKKLYESLRNPEETIRRFMPYLKDDGYFLISLPNIRYYAVCMMLVQYGRFDYADSGILDSTHLKFFTKSTAVEILERCNLEVVQMEKNYFYCFVKRND